MRKNRLDEMISLIEQYDIETQEELTQLLKKAGYAVTQATVSRDIKVLGLVKASIGKGRQKYILPAQISDDLGAKHKSVLKTSFISMEPAMNLLVIKTVSGMAMAAAAALDTMELSEIVGAVAGDDTILIATRSLEDVESLRSKLQKML